MRASQVRQPEEQRLARSGGAWSVKGIDQATRDIAKRAAQASGLTIGEWIDRAILQDARSKGLSIAPDPTTAQSDRAGSGAGSSGRVGGVSPEVMAELHRRLDASDARIDAALRPIAYSLHDLAVRLVEAEQAARAAPPRELAGPLQDREDAPDPDSERFAPEESVPEEVPLEDQADLPDLPDLPAGPPSDWEPDADLNLDMPPAPEPEVEPEPATAEMAPQDPEISIPAVPVAAAPKPLARPAPQPPRYDFPLAAEGLPDPDAGDEPAELAAQTSPETTPEPETTAEAESDTPEEPDAPDLDPVSAAISDPRPEPEPPRGDLSPGDLAGSVQGFQGPAGRPVSIEDAIAPFVDRQDQPGLSSEAVAGAPAKPHRSRARTAAALLAAAVLLLGTVLGAWWFGGGGRITDPDRMMAALGERLAQAQVSVADAAGEAWQRAQEELAGLLPSERASDAASAPVDVAPSAETPPAALPKLEMAEKPADPQAPPEVAAEVAETTPPVAGVAEAPADPDQVARAPTVESPRVESPRVETPKAEAPKVEAPRAPAPKQDPADVMPPPAPAPAPPVEQLAQVPPPPAPAVAATRSAPPEAAPEAAPVPAADQSVPAAPVGVSGAPEQAPVQDVSSALQDRTAALPPEAPDLPTAELRARAIAGDPRAQNDLASRLIGADPPDVEEAADWFREAAIQGVPGAQYNLGVLYERGLGVRQDETRALLWYHSAAEQGHPLAQYNLGILYAAGRSVPLSYAEAAVWFERAAARGVPAAAYNLAVLLEGGLGRPRDMEQAMAYYARAKELGHKGAAQRLAGETPTSVGDGLLDLAETTSNSGTVGVREIAAIQERLSEIGFYTGTVDGIAGPQTRAAIGRYQASEDLPVTGLPSTGLLRHLQGHT